MEILAVLQDTALGAAMRTSWWLYPLVNVVHVLGLAALFGAVLVLDLHMLGLWRATDAAALVRPAAAVAAAGLLVAVASGVPLFAARATEYAAMPVFLAKIACVAVGAANAGIARATGLDRRAPRRVAAVSLAAWTGAVVSGRLIGYWEA